MSREVCRSAEVEEFPFRMGQAEVGEFPRLGREQQQEYIRRPSSLWVMTTDSALDRTFTGHFAPNTAGALTDAWSLRGFHDSHWTRDAMTSWAVSDRNDHQLDQFVRVLTS